jgi:hypothetical protein
MLLPYIDHAGFCQMNTPLRYLRLLALISFLAALEGCVSSSVVSTTITPTKSPVTKIAVVMLPDSFARGNMASITGSASFRNLSPHLESRIPTIFSLNGVRTRSFDLILLSSSEPPKFDVGEKILSISPSSSIYSSRSGQSLAIRAELFGSLDKSERIWQAEISLQTMGFGKFDEKLADEIAVKLLQKMRNDNIVLATDAPILTQ